MIYYFTFNDQPSGIYSSQVLDTLAFLRGHFEEEIRLVAFFPSANFEKNKSKVLEKEPTAIVLRMVFGISRWKWHKIILKLKLRSKGSKIICRGPIAAELAMIAGFKKVVYDGRAAVKAEVEEYDVTMGNAKLGDDFIQAEKRAVIQSEFRLAVSHELVNYWREEIGYRGSDYVVVPCTLNNEWFEENLKDVLHTNDTVKLVYSGGTGPWQSFGLVVDMLRVWLSHQEDGVILFMTKENDLIDSLINDYPNRVERKFVAHEEVKRELSSCDYGILIRENRVTNKVASPVKFAEYLSAGLKVLISEEIGDYSKFVQRQECGVIITDDIPELPKVSPEDKNRLRQLCSDHFRKEKFISEYKTLLKE